MIIPRYSLRSLLLVMTGAAVVFSIVGLGVRGTAWAGAVSIAIGSLAVLMLIYAFLFAVVWTFSLFAPIVSRSPAAQKEAPVGRPAEDPEIPAAPILLDDPPETPKEP